MLGQRKDHTLQPSDLLHEAWIRLFHASDLDKLKDRNHLLQVAAKAMRQILVDHSRRRDAAKRGGNWQRVPFDAVLDYLSEQRVDVEAIKEALEELEQLDPRQATIVTLRVIAGFTAKEVGERLGIPVAKVEKEYRVGKAWLRKRLRGMP